MKINLANVMVATNRKVRSKEIKALELQGAMNDEVQKLIADTPTEVWCSPFKS